MSCDFTSLKTGKVYCDLWCWRRTAKDWVSMGTRGWETRMVGRVEGDFDEDCVRGIFDVYNWVKRWKINAKSKTSEWVGRWFNIEEQGAKWIFILRYLSSVPTMLLIFRRDRWVNSPSAVSGLNIHHGHHNSPFLSHPTFSGSPHHSFLIHPFLPPHHDSSISLPRSTIEKSHLHPQTLWIPAHFQLHVPWNDHGHLAPSLSLSTISPPIYLIKFHSHKTKFALLRLNTNSAVKWQTLPSKLVKSWPTLYSGVVKWYVLHPHFPPQHNPFLHRRIFFFVMPLFLPRSSFGLDLFSSWFDPPPRQQFIPSRPCPSPIIPSLIPTPGHRCLSPWNRNCPKNWCPKSNRWQTQSWWCKQSLRLWLQSRFRWYEIYRFRYCLQHHGRRLCRRTKTPSYQKQINLQSQPPIS